MQREQQSCRAGQHDLLFRRVNDGLQFAAFERGISSSAKLSAMRPKAIITGDAPQDSDHLTIGPETLTPATASATRSAFF